MSFSTISSRFGSVQAKSGRVLTRPYNRVVSGRGPSSFAAMSSMDRADERKMPERSHYHEGGDIEARNIIFAQMCTFDSHQAMMNPQRRSFSASPASRSPFSQRRQFSTSPHVHHNSTQHNKDQKEVKDKQSRFAKMSDEELVASISSGVLKLPLLEQELGDHMRAVQLRREVIAKAASSDALSALPYEEMDYSKVAGQCCENVIGYTTIPVGVAGPLVVDGVEYYVPMATTEGALVASTSRGCKAISMSGGARTVLMGDGMSRAPVLGVPDIATGLAVTRWVEEHFDELAAAFNSTSRFARLSSIQPHLAGRKLFLKFRSSSGDAMGMNMVGKGVEKALNILVNEFPTLRVMSLSGNVCTDKKPSAINWLEGRGKSIVCEAVIPGHIVTSVLKTSVAALVELNYAKNLVGSAVAGSIGGYNAHASNVVTSIFLATGQDPAQNVESSNCMTLIEPTNNGADIHLSVTMPCMEVGTVGGGTALPAQNAMLRMLGVNGAHPENPGQNAARLARIIGSAVMAGELSLMAALTSGDLIKSHMKLNRNPHPHPTAGPSPSS